MESLLTSFHRERQREENKTGSVADEVYKSTWFAFSSMGFLLAKFAVKKTVNTEELSYQNIEERHINTAGNCNPTAKPSQNQEPDGASTDKNESTTTPSSSRRKKSRFLDLSTPNQRNQSRADKAYDLMMEKNEKRCLRDETYGDHIAAKHRKYSQHTKSVVEDSLHMRRNSLHHIHNPRTGSIILISNIISVIPILGHLLRCHTHTVPSPHPHQLLLKPVMLSYTKILIHLQSTYHLHNRFIKLHQSPLKTQISHHWHNLSIHSHHSNQILQKVNVPTRMLNFLKLKSYTLLQMYTVASSSFF